MPTLEQQIKLTGQLLHLCASTGSISQLLQEPGARSPEMTEMLFRALELFEANRLGAVSAREESTPLVVPEAASREALEKRVRARVDPQILSILLHSVDLLEVSVRAGAFFSDHDVLLIGQLVQWTEHALLDKKKIGRREVQSWRSALAPHGLSLGMTPEDYPLVAQFNLIHPQMGEAQVVSVQEKEDRHRYDHLCADIAILELSKRVSDGLEANHIFHVGDLVQRSPEDICAIKGLKRVALREIREMLEAYGFSLGMKESEHIALAAFNFLFKHKSLFM